jgi:hypothetical protein
VTTGLQRPGQSRSLKKDASPRPPLAFKVRSRGPCDIPAQAANTMPTAVSAPFVHPH